MIKKMGSFLTRGFNWLTGGKFSEPFSSRIVGCWIRAEGRKERLLARLIRFIDALFPNDGHCWRWFKEYNGKR